MKKIILCLGCIFGICMIGRAEMIVGLNAGGELWKADTASFNGTKQKLATLTEGANYIDSACDGTYFYGLRSDGAVYRSDVQGDVSQVSVSGWSDVKAISAKQGTLYGMTAAGTIMGTDGAAVVAVTGSTFPWVGFSITDDGKFWMLTGGGKSLCYAFTNGFAGPVPMRPDISQGNASGLALKTAGNDLFVLRVYTSQTAFYKNTTFLSDTGIIPADLAAGDAVYYIETTGKIWMMPPVVGGKRTVVGTIARTDFSFVGIEVVPAHAAR
ncbi:MAG: hypothetical protein WC701_00605 [Kiritimatiellales bacterium]